MRFRPILLFSALLAAVAATTLTSAHAARIYVDLQDCELHSITDEHILALRIVEKHFTAQDTKEQLISIISTGQGGPAPVVRKFANCRITFKAVIVDSKKTRSAGSELATEARPRGPDLESDEAKLKGLLEWLSDSGSAQVLSEKRADKLNTQDATSSAPPPPPPPQTENTIEVVLDSQVGITGVASTKPDVTYNTLAPWHLDRLSLPRSDGIYTVPAYYTNASIISQTDVYIVDTGVLATHEAFRNTNSSQSRVQSRLFDAYSSDTIINKHGTHVADGAAGNRILGPELAGRVPHARRIFDVRVLNRNGTGYFSDIFDGLRAVTDHCNGTRVSGRIPGVVVNLSLGGGYSDSLASMLRSLFTDIQVWCEGVVVVSAGNDATDACEQLPSGLEGRDLGETITVGSMDDTDSFSASYSNYGRCVTFVQPGTDILAAVSTCNTCYEYMTGTSMASPNMAAVVSFLMSTEPLSWRNRSTFSVILQAQQIMKKDLVRSNSILLYGSVVFNHLANTADAGKLSNVPGATPNRVAVLDPVSVLSNPQKPDDDNNSGNIIFLPEPPVVYGEGAAFRLGESLGTIFGCLVVALIDLLGFGPAFFL